MRKYVLIVLMLLIAGSLSAQQLSNVDAEQQNKKAVITYDFATKAGVSDYEIKLFVSTDGGKTWQQVLSGLSGDIGKTSSSGHKTIVWDVLADRDKLQGEDIRFKVTATFNDFGNYTETVGSVHFDMIAINGGSFIMGSPEDEEIITQFYSNEKLITSHMSDFEHDDEKQHTAILSDFYISATEVTFEQYDSFCNATGRIKPDDNGWGRGNLPAFFITWNDATEYCKWLSNVTGLPYRLPTEAEWEYACRAGTSTPFNTGSDLTSAQANINNPSGKTMAVGSFAPNAWGLYDMHGNVWEWCSDWYDSNYSIYSLNNPQGPQSGISHVNRGGCCLNDNVVCRSASRGYCSSTNCYLYVGFRVACSPVH